LDRSVGEPRGQVFATVWYRSAGENLRPCKALPGSELRIAPDGDAASFHSRHDTSSFITACIFFRTEGPVSKCNRQQS
jgi:hypothetical protein